MDWLSSDDQSSHYGIYTGLWTNWSRGAIFGATITLPRQEGAILIVVIALFISLVGTSFWKILCFGLHYAFSSSTPQDGLYHQRQAILRNSSSGAMGLCSLLRVLWAWKRTGGASRPVRRIVPVVCVTLCCIIAFGAAGILSAKLSTAIGNEVLVVGSNCGILQAENNLNVSELTAYFNSYDTQLATSHATLAQQCYENTSDIADCRAFVKRSLPTQITRNASCPFKDEICLLKDGNIRFDTGYLDSNDDLGLNAPLHERVQFRRISTCAPITTKGHRRQYKLSRSNSSFVEYNYGLPGNEWAEFQNFTYGYPMVSLDEWEPLSILLDYTLSGTDAFVMNGSMKNNNSDFFPIPALAQTNADVHLVFLSANSIIFTHDVDDPWYSAHRHASQTTYLHQGLVSGALATVYQDDAVSVLGCTVQEQYCNPTTRHCAPLGGEFESTALAADIWTDDKQRATFHWLDAIIKSYTPVLYQTVYKLGASGALVSRKTLHEGFQGPLAADQWQRDAQHWHATALAALQSVMKEVATGPSDSTVEAWLTKPSSAHEHHLCRSQKIVNADYFNFSVFGLALSLALGALLILLPYLLEPLLGCCVHQKRRCGRKNAASYALLEWSANDVLQLQRLAHEELDMGTWDCCGAAAVPVTKRGERLAVLDIRDSKHPRLKVVKCEGGGSDEESLVSDNCSTARLVA